MRLWVLCVVPMLFLSACASVTGDGQETDEPARPGKLTPEAALLWLPNRIMDLGDIVRVGVDVGPGLGYDLQVGDGVARTMHRSSLGIGYQTLRHPPLKAGTEESADFSATGEDYMSGRPWTRSPTDLRLELHPLLGGAHAAIDFGEIVDFFGGLFLFDTKNDDF